MQRGNMLTLLWRVITRVEVEHKSLGVNPLFIPLKLDFPNRLKASRDTHQYPFLGGLGKIEILGHLKQMTQI